MQILAQWLDELYERKIKQEYDRVVPVVGDEGAGKSTLMLQIVWLWKDVTGQPKDVEEVLDQIVWSQEGFENALADYPPRAVIPVPDAARVLHSKESMTSEQVELQKDFLDSRMKEFLILLGYQDWDDIPRFLRKRRAKNLLYIPGRGMVRGYNRRSMNEKLDLDPDEWPAADLTDSFPSLEGKELWRRYKQLDRQKKEERMRSDAEETEKAERLKNLAAEIKDGGLGAVVSLHGNTGEPYVDRDLIELEYGLSEPDARKVKKLLERDSDVDLEAVA